jgi:hypothetical protein
MNASKDFSRSCLYACPGESALFNRQRSATAVWRRSCAWTSRVATSTSDFIAPPSDSRPCATPSATASTPRNCRLSLGIDARCPIVLCSDFVHPGCERGAGGGRLHRSGKCILLLSARSYREVIRDDNRRQGSPAGPLNGRRDRHGCVEDVHPSPRDGREIRHSQNPWLTMKEVSGTFVRLATLQLPPSVPRSPRRPRLLRILETSPLRQQRITASPYHG